jgi:hypothetical protein
MKRPPIQTTPTNRGTLFALEKLVDASVPTDIVDPT